MCADTRVDFEHAYQNAVCRLRGVSEKIAVGLRSDDFCLTGGAVRDIFIGEMVGRATTVKDYDIIMPSSPSLYNNVNVSDIRKNSFGGIKFILRGVGEIDVFHQYTNDVPGLVANRFDFTCNSLYYSNHTQRIEYSVYFLHFVETLMLRMCVGYVASLESIIIRAIKFKIKFAHDFGLNVGIGRDIMNVISAMGKSDDAAVQKYADVKIKDADLRQRVIEYYYMQKGCK